MLKIKVEKIIEVDGANGQKVLVHAGTYEQTVHRTDAYEAGLVKRIVAEVNDLKML